MLYDLNDGLFSELTSATPTIELYRRDLQRAYVILLVQRIDGPPSEFRAGVRLGAVDLLDKITPAAKKAKGATAAHLHDLAVELGRVR
jgi:ribosomal protein S18 acetylase RimI-like enzyme